MCRDKQLCFAFLNTSRHVYEEGGKWYLIYYYDMTGNKRESAIRLALGEVRSFRSIICWQIKCKLFRSWRGEREREKGFSWTVFKYIYIYLLLIFWFENRLRNYGNNNQSDLENVRSVQTCCCVKILLDWIRWF